MFCRWLLRKSLCEGEDLGENRENEIKTLLVEEIQYSVPVANRLAESIAEMDAMATLLEVKHYNSRDVMEGVSDPMSALAT